MFNEDLIIPLVAIIAVFGPAFYIIYLTGKLIKYRIDKKYNSEYSVKAQEMNEFIERTENRLRALEEIVSDEEYDTEPKTLSSRKIHPEKDPASGPDKEKNEDIWSSEKSRLKNQLKS